MRFYRPPGSDYMWAGGAMSTAGRVRESGCGVGTSKSGAGARSTRSPWLICYDTSMGAHRIFRVGISGSYGGLNLGDEAILQSIIHQLDRSLPAEITVFSRDAEDTSRRHNVRSVIPVRTYSRIEVVPEIERLDLFILGGGGILFDGEAKTFMREVQVAREKGVPVLVYAVGVGPLQNPDEQNAVQAALNKVAAVTVRDREGKKLLEDIGVKRTIIVAADPAFLLEAEPVPDDTVVSEGFKGDRSIIGISVREPGPAAPGLDADVYYQLVANAADFMIERFGAKVVFVSMERPSDMQHAHAIISRMLFPEHAWVLKREYTSGQVLSIMKYLQFAVGMRLHFLIFAAMQGIPFVGLPYAAKVGGMLGELSIKMPPIHLVNAGRLIAYIDSYWDQQETIKASIAEKLPRLKERALIPNRIAVQMLKGTFHEDEWNVLP